MERPKDDKSIIKELLGKLIEYIIFLYLNKHWIRGSLLISAILVVLFGVPTLAVLFLALTLDVVAERQEIFIIIMLAVAGLVWLVLYKKQVKETALPEKLMPPFDLEKDSANRTYENLSYSILMAVNNVSHILNVACASTVEEIVSKSRAIKTGNIWYYPYTFIKLGDIPPLFTDILQEELTRMQYNGELYGLECSLKEIDGIKYPLLIADSAKEEIAHVTINITIVTKKYLALHRDRAAKAHDMMNHVHDTEDEEFLV